MDAGLVDAEGTLMRCGQTMPLLVGGHVEELYTQSLHCDRPTSDLHLQDGPPQDTRYAATITVLNGFCSCYSLDRFLLCCH